MAPSIELKSTAECMAISILGVGNNEGTGFSLNSKRCLLFYEEIDDRHLWIIEIGARRGKNSRRKHERGIQ